MHTDDHDVAILNGLIATTIDSADGYREAANDAQSDRFRSIFMERADERDDVVEQLSDRVRELGSDPANNGTTRAAAHRVFMNLREAVTGTDDTAIISEVERGEDHIKAKYEDALTDKDLSTETMGIVRECFTSVKSGHDQMRDMKHSLTDK